jgi:hypothetical protein
MSPWSRSRPQVLQLPMVVVLALGLPGASCQQRATPAGAARRATTRPVPVPPTPPPGRLPAPARLVAIGDLHGDLQATRAALRLAGALGEGDHWAGGALVVVQTGDLVDRGHDDRAVLDLFARLSTEATAAGGAVITLNGNHELMNVAGDFRYVTGPSFEAFADLAPREPLPPALADLPARRLGRAFAFAPGGPYARLLAGWNTVEVVGDTVFVHGGLTPAHVRYGLDAINRAVRRWMLGEAELPPLLEGEESPVWLRTFSTRDDPEACAALDAVLAAIPAQRLVIGHTPQRDGIDAACQGRVWRIDAGLSHHYGGPLQVLEIRGAQVRVLGEGAPAAS